MIYVNPILMRFLHVYKRTMRNILVLAGNAWRSLAGSPAKQGEEPDHQKDNAEHHEEHAACVEKENDISPGKLFERPPSLNMKIEMGTSLLPVPSGMTRFFDIYTKTINSAIHHE